jgi:hypothetical protein
LYLLNFSGLLIGRNSTLLTVHLNQQPIVSTPKAFDVIQLCRVSRERKKTATCLNPTKATFAVCPGAIFHLWEENEEREQRNKSSFFE